MNGLHATKKAFPHLILLSIASEKKEESEEYGW